MRMKNKSMILMIRAKKSGNIIGLKEDIAMRLAGVMDIERIDVAEDAAEVVRRKDCKHYGTSRCAMDTYAFDVVEECFCGYGERKEV